VKAMEAVARSDNGALHLADIPFTAPFSGTPAWTSIPSWAVIGTDDQVVPPAELTVLAQRAHWQITYVKAGHLSMIA
jgi:hypothetical protein